MEKTMLTALNGIGIFGNLSPMDQQRLVLLLTARSFNPNETIFVHGEEGQGLYIIRSGKVKICTDDPQGNELIFTFLSAGDLLGEIAILDGQPRSATAVAVTHTDTFYLDRGRFLDFLKTSPQACMDIIVTLCNSLRRSNAHLEEVSFLDVSGRVARSLMSMSPKEEFPPNCAISQEELARVVGASRVMVNKILNSFSDLGLITQTRKKITILNERELNRIGDYNLCN
jgi:CRP/FNR family cyclic AMP-dependent transcriptional regulator